MSIHEQEAANSNGDEITAGNMENSVVAIGRGASVTIQHFPIVSRTPLRHIFDSLIDDRARYFVGREDVLKQVADFISNTDGGFLVLTSPSGFGRTTLLAHLAHAKPEAFAYHFFWPQYPSTLDQIFFIKNIVQQMASFCKHKEGYDNHWQLLDSLDDLNAL